ncbi:hypothetical protein CAC42_6565 [Sphaceloma murrayae]|uniref:HhH-GPD domain-containing protein n=1 Tax=Sphaceloma murrayae TaxID=2082308 RepID=A0A2K1QGN6_9PEZI|nr:hypothetical protein CAC42_6565 [Sphaceloma murrayae]
MARRSTRSQAAAAEPTQLSSPPGTPAPPSKRSTRKSRGKSSTDVEDEEVKQEDVKQEDVKQEPSTPAPSAGRKRGRAPAKAESPLNDLPHNLGDIPTPSSEPPTKKARSNQVSPKKKKKDAATPAKKATPNQKPGSKKIPQPSAEEMEKVAANAGLVSPSPSTKDGKKKKSTNYKLTPGQSPYQGYNRPTAEECHEVVRLLSKVHGNVSKPKEIRAPSLTTAGCGEVPSVLDALIRTRLSAATTGTNSSRAFQGLVKTFGTIKEGTGKGSVDWNAVRKAPLSEVFEAIKCGGLAGAKSKDIKAILDSVWEENQARAAGLQASSSSSPGKKGVKQEANVEGAENEADEEKHVEIAQVEKGILSLDHLHLLSSEEAFNKLVTYPGIGPKTASCVLLFCLQRPSFAVDTHVFRLCRYLGWVPSDAEAKEQGWPRVERNTTYSHCEVMIPDELKYALHQLLIKHGKTCGRCRAATGMGSEGWKKGCPIDHLVKRHGAKKGEMGVGESDDEEEEEVSAPRKRRARKDESESEEAEMSDLGSEGAEMSDLGSDEADDVSTEGDDDDE